MYLNNTVMEEANLPATLDDVLAELKKIRQQNNIIVTQNTDIKNELAEVKREYESTKNELENCKAEIITVNNKHKQMEDICDELVERVKILEEKLVEETMNRSHAENNNRKMNVEITGIPILNNENCKEIVSRIGRAMGINNIAAEDVDVAHRLYQAQGDTIPKLIARFKSRTDRESFYERRFQLKDITIKDLGYESTADTERLYNRIYINESLSKYTKQLFRKCRIATRINDFYSCYVEKGVTIVKETQMSKKLRINNIYDYQNIFG